MPSESMAATYIQYDDLWQCETLIADAFGTRDLPRMARGKTEKSSDLRRLMAARLKAARLAYMENGAEMARVLGISPQTLNAYERGRNFPDEQFLVRFCNLTGCPTDWILRGRMTATMSADMAARIGHFAPALVPGLERGLAASGEETAGVATWAAADVDA